MSPELYDFILSFLAGYISTMAAYFMYEKVMRLARPKCKHSFSLKMVDDPEDGIHHMEKHCVYCKKIVRWY